MRGGWTSAVVALSWVAGCNAVWGLDPGAFDGDGGRGGGGGMMVNASSSTGGSGGEAPCEQTGSCPAGTACAQPDGCASGRCVDGVCCAEACDGVCEACNLDPPGQCTPHPAGTDPDGECRVSPDEALSCNGLRACGGAYRWSGAFGSPSEDVGAAVAVDELGAMVLAGRCSGAADFGGGPVTSNGNGDACVAKLGPQGEHLWSRSFGGMGTDAAEAVAIDASTGDVLVTGRFRNTMTVGSTMLSAAGETDGFVARFNSAGDPLWAVDFGNAQFERGLSVATDDQGNALFGGFQTNLNFSALCVDSNPPVNGIFVAKLNPEGMCLWSRSLEGGKGFDGVAVTVDAAGNVLVTGSIAAAVGLGGDTLDYVAGADLFVLKLDPDGQHLWSTSFGGSGDDVGVAITTTLDGRVLVTGMFDSPSLDLDRAGILSTAGQRDAFLLELDGNGVPIQGMRFGGGANDFGYAVAVDPSGARLVAGVFRGNADFGGGTFSSAGSGDVFVAKLSAAGEHLWSRRFGGGADDGDIFLALDASGELLLAGSFSGSADFGGPALASAGLRDIVVLKLGP